MKRQAERGIKRRQFLRAAGAGLATTAVAAPAIAQSMPELKWRLTSAFPKSLDALFGAAETFAKAVSEATDGKFRIQSFAAGEIVGTFQAADAVGSGTVEMSHTAPYYYIGKDPTFALGCTVPFGLNPRQANAWAYEGGMDLMNDFYSKFNLFALLGGNTGVQMGGWFRKEIKSVADLRGLKMRIGGLAGQVLQKLGLVPQQIAAGEVYSSLERGAIDAAEWVGPYDDEKLGLNRVAPYYYYPGFWDPGPILVFFVHKAKWDELPKQYKAIVRTAAEAANVEMQARYDARNPAALRRLIAAGALLRPFPQDLMERSYQAANELYDELSSKNENWKKVYESLRSFRGEQYLWWQVAEYTYDNFMIRRPR